MCLLCAYLYKTSSGNKECYDEYYLSQLGSNLRIITGKNTLYCTGCVLKVVGVINAVLLMYYKGDKCKSRARNRLKIMCNHLHLWQSNFLYVRLRY